MNLRRQYYRPMVPRPRPLLREHSLAASLLATEKDHSNPQGNWPNANGPLSSAQSVSQSLHQSVLKCPRSTAQASIALTSALICRRTSALRLASARFSFVSRPWVVCSAASRALPSSVRGPVRASVEPAASYWELGWPLAKRASSRSGLAPCAWPVLAEAGLLAYSVAFGKHFKHPNY